MLTDFEYAPLGRRRITEKTCRKWGYAVGDYNGKPVQVAQYRDERGRMVAQKLRFPDKSFIILGDPKRMGLYGRHLCPPTGKIIVITEGEIDALSMSQAQDLKWPVVSIPNGVDSAAKVVAENLDFFGGYERVVIMFDQDEAGEKGSQAVAEVLTPGQAYIASLPLNDVNDMVQAGRSGELISAMWNAAPYRVDGIVVGSDLWDVVRELKDVESIPYPWDSLNKDTRGMRQGEVVVVTAGTGIGKSTICREIAYDMVYKRDLTVGYIALEESVRYTAVNLMGIHLNKRIHLDDEFRDTPEEDLKSAFDAVLGTGNMLLYDHFGSMESDRLMHKMRQMVRGFGCRFIILDHLSIVISQYEDGDERRRIDSVMTKLRTLAEELHVGIIVVSHLKRVDGKPLEEGGQVSLSLLRGSGSIGQIADIAIGAERDQQGENPNTIQLRILKNRYTGEVGPAGHLTYNRDTGRLVATTSPEEGALTEAQTYGF